MADKIIKESTQEIESSPKGVPVRYEVTLSVKAPEPSQGIMDNLWGMMRALVKEDTEFPATVTVHEKGAPTTDHDTVYKAVYSDGVGTRNMMTGENVQTLTLTGIEKNGAAAADNKLGGVYDYSQPKRMELEKGALSATQLRMLTSNLTADAAPEIPTSYDKKVHLCFLKQSEFGDVVFPPSSDPAVQKKFEENGWEIGKKIRENDAMVTAIAKALPEDPSIVSLVSSDLSRGSDLNRISDGDTRYQARMLLKSPYHHQNRKDGLVAAVDDKGELLTVFSYKKEGNTLTLTHGEITDKAGRDAPLEHRQIELLPDGRMDPGALQMLVNRFVYRSDPDYAFGQVAGPAEPEKSPVEKPKPAFNHTITHKHGGEEPHAHLNPNHHLPKPKHSKDPKQQIH